MKSTRSQRDVRLRRLLENCRGEVEEGVRALREIALQERGEVRDAPEQSAHDSAQDLELAVLQMKSVTLAPIAEARLGALPFARLCVACQRVKEEGRESLIRAVVDAAFPFSRPGRGARKRRAPRQDEGSRPPRHMDRGGLSTRRHGTSGDFEALE